MGQSTVNQQSGDSSLSTVITREKLSMDGAMHFAGCN